MDPWEGGGEAGVALVFGDRDLAGFGDKKIRARDSHVGIDVEPPHVAAGDHRQLFRAVGGGRTEILLEEVADLIAADVHAGEDKVIRRLTP